MEEDVERRINEELERLRTLDEGQRKVSNTLTPNS